MYSGSPGSTVTVASHAMGSETGPTAKTLNLAAKSTARGPAAPAAFAEQAARRHVEFGPGPSPPQPAGLPALDPRIRLSSALPCVPILGKEETSTSN